jgi:hyperosmotically inducible periplasmic protein
MFRALLRAILVVIVVGAAIGFFLGYRWSDLVSDQRDVDRPGVAGPDGTDRAVDASKAREHGERAGEAIGTAAERAGQRASEAASEAGEVLSDAALTAKIKSKMALDDHVRASSIGVTTKDGRVTLTGTVGSDDERRRAVDLARDTKGVSGVDDRIVVRRN